jgi:hypothetical protein
MNVKEFKTDGEWTAPKGVYVVLVEGLGGGGGGAGAWGVGGGGGASGAYYLVPTNVTPSKTYKITVGAGGKGGNAGAGGFPTHYAHPGTTGGNTLFDELLVFPGGAGGGLENLQYGQISPGGIGRDSGRSGGAGGRGPTGQTAGTQGEPFLGNQGGAGGGIESGIGDPVCGGGGGGGGASIIGSGGAGGVGRVAGPEPRPGQTAQHQGAGGGGGGGAAGSPEGGAGGDGGAGILRIYW